MNYYKEICGNCVYWIHIKCTMTGEIKNGYSICTCGQFQKRKEITRD